MDGLIQMLPAPLRRYSTYMDFVGQKRAERTFQVILVVHGIVGFIVGYILQQLSVTVYIVLFGFALSSLVVLPPWPFFRAHPLKWQPVAGASTATAAATSATAASAAEKKKKK